ncbi:MAG: hypothetical protein ING73_14465, partial [Rhodocyclaceae bacterium]|nr:hypothetical protein [Rhodocyclaceae bacterium]
MATLEKIIFDIAKPVFTDGQNVRLFYIEADEQIDPAVGDYCVFNVVGGAEPARSLTQFGGYATARIQFAILSKRAINLPDKVKALRQAFEAANAAKTLICSPLGIGYDLPSDESSMFG